MTLINCPLDEETGLFLRKMTIARTTCERCPNPVHSVVILEDKNLGEEKTVFLCVKCLKSIIDLDKQRKAEL